ncbi:MAG: hypothetical protein K2W78_15210 [Xanthobacteraceae bacterium]|nr:hypothetical protein [Xanthobacteraceae bacterium]
MKRVEVASPSKPKIADATTVTPGQPAQVSVQNGTVIQVQLVPAKPGVLDPQLYAPAIPGVIVALLGLWIAHCFSARRDFRKEVADCCSDLKGLVDEAFTAASKAWVADPGSDRIAAINETKHKIQVLGIASTTLSRKTKGSVDLSSEITKFRRACTSDPFEDPTRIAENVVPADMLTAMIDLYARADHKLIDYWGN